MTQDEKLDELAKRTREAVLPWREDIDAYRTSLIRAALAEAVALERARCAGVCMARAERFKAEAATMEHPFRRLLLLSDAGEAVYCANAIEVNNEEN